MAANLERRAPAQKLDELNEALDRFTQQTDQAKEQRDRWIREVRKRVDAHRRME